MFSISTRFPYLISRNSNVMISIHSFYHVDFNTFPHVLVTNENTPQQRECPTFINSYLMSIVAYELQASAISRQISSITQ